MNDITIISILLLSTRNRSLYSTAHACHVVAAWASIGHAKDLVTIWLSY